jgi:hypothetical protein
MSLRVRANLSKSRAPPFRQWIAHCIAAKSSKMQIAIVVEVSRVETGGFEAEWPIKFVGTALAK